jgi:5-methylcytosine-specific restriction endonuclease McrA
MSNQNIDPHLRHAIWLGHNRRCIYCSEPLSFAEVDIDHIIPKSLFGKPELAEALAKLDLPPDFDLMSIENLVPAHRRCNLVKSADVFKEGSARFYLHQAGKSSPKVRPDLIEKET